jgi:hypothetical protein
MRCPYCSKEIHAELHESQAYEYARVQGCTGIDAASGFCPSCRGFLVVVRNGDLGGTAAGPKRITNVVLESVVYPPFAATRELQHEIPEPYRNTFAEAERVLVLSANASAAFGRRLLQNVLRDNYGIKETSLRKEIEGFISEEAPPAYLAQALDAVRVVGNFTAYPSKDTSTGDIAEAGPGEAEWLLDTLEALFDFAFVRPLKLAEMKRQTNEKLKRLGKPEMLR